VTGGAGFLGSHLVDRLLEEKKVPRENIRVPRSLECDLRKMTSCKRAVEGEDIVIHLAAKVGGIGYNRKYPGTLFYDNAVMGIQLIEAARQEEVEKIVLIGTVCAYPKYTRVPFKEEDLWEGYPEETNAPYGIAKKILLTQSKAYREQYGLNSIYLLPVNLYGPRDNFHPEHSHVIPALIRKIIEARNEKREKVVAWGTGTPSREFLYVEDAAKGIIMAAEKYNKSEPVNLGTGKETTIKELVDLIANISDFKGKIYWDTSKPDGQPRRCLDINKALEEFNFKAKTSLRDGLIKTINWFIENY
jgi:GDP-L-fucose synthase